MKKIVKKIKQQIDWLIYGHHEDGINIDGLLSKGIDEELAKELGEQLVDFGKYSFEEFIGALDEKSLSKLGVNCKKPKS